MNTSFSRLFLESELLNNLANFIEIQVHDNIQNNWEKIQQKIKLTEHFHGFITLHGEGETDGKKRILFSEEPRVRIEYVKKCALLYNLFIEKLKRVNRIIIHPGTINPKINRFDQIRNLAHSLILLQDIFPNIQICVEPRGCTRHRKILQIEYEDISILYEVLSQSGCTKIGLCIDIAQLFICKGNSSIIPFLDSINKDIMELHLSDVINKRIGVEIGKGLINWKNIVPEMKKYCQDLLIETLGGLNVYNRSLKFLQINKIIV